MRASTNTDIVKKNKSQANTQQTTIPLITRGRRTDYSHSDQALQHFIESKEGRIHSLLERSSDWTYPRPPPSHGTDTSS